jgi:hypothetical protein
MSETISLNTMQFHQLITTLNNINSSLQEIKKELAVISNSKIN